MNLQTPPGLDLTACDREPIHIPGSIQPHGILLAIRLPDGTMTYHTAHRAPALGQPPGPPRATARAAGSRPHASASAAAFLGLDSASVLGRPFRAVLPD